MTTTALLDAPATSGTPGTFTPGPDDLFIAFCYSSGDGQPSNSAWKVTGCGPDDIARMANTFKGIDPDVQARYAADEPGASEAGMLHARFRAYLAALGLELTPVPYGQIYRHPGLKNRMYAGDLGHTQWD